MDGCGAATRAKQLLATRMIDVGGLAEFSALAVVFQLQRFH